MAQRAAVTRRLIALAMVVSALSSTPLAASEPLIIAHRGASGDRPEHTLAAYELAILQGADFIEPDLVPTRDGVLVARHENEISGTTDVASRPEFANRRATRIIDGREITGWFAEDFTLTELRSLRARERLPELRAGNTRFDGLYPVPTFAEVAQLVRAMEQKTGRKIGIYPEIKHPAYFDEAGHDMVALLLAAIEEADLADATDHVFIQCFEIGPLERLAGLTQLPLVQLVSSRGGPADRDLTYAEMLSDEGLRGIAEYADAIGPDVDLVLDPEGAFTGLVERAGAAGLKVHVWTIRRENAFLPERLRSGSDPASPGDMAGLLAELKQAGVRGLFTDHPGEVRESALLR